jgi:hypothetical protein
LWRGDEGWMVGERETFALPRSYDHLSNLLSCI